MPPLQSLSLRSDAYSPEPLVARSVRISSTRLQTQPPTVRPGPRPLGPAIPSEIPLADVTVHPTWRPPGVAGNISATDLPPAASYSDRMATPVEDDPSIVTPSAQRGDAVAGKPARVTSPPAAPSVPPSWLSATSRRLNHSEDATLVHSLHSLHSLSVCELRAELLEGRAVTPQEVEACVGRTDLEALLRDSRRILAAADAAVDAAADAAAEAAVEAAVEVEAFPPRRLAPLPHSRATRLHLTK